MEHKSFSSGLAIWIFSGAGLFCVGSFFLYIGAVDMILARESVDWPYVTGRITESKVHRWGSDRDKKKSYSPIIRYSYEVNGVSYKNNIISYELGTGGGRHHAHKIVAKYPKGSGVKVYYRPKDPSKSLLETGTESGSWLGILMGTVAIIIGFILGFIVPVKIRSKRILDHEYKRQMEI